MKQYAFLSTLALLAFGISANAQEIVHPDSTGFKFTDVKVVKQTSVKDQNKTGTCWCFSTNSNFETDRQRSGLERNVCGLPLLCG